MNILLVPPKGAAKSSTVNGRVYSCAANGTITAPDFDAAILSANGWVEVAPVGTTAQRPATPFPNQLYHDTTLGYVIVWEGAAWRNPNTGGAV